MILNTDSYFSIGSTHKHCEDYALSNSNSDLNITTALISDGCSGSKNTDFGARIISKCAQNQSKYYLPHSEPIFRENILKNISFCKDTLELNTDSLDATLLYTQCDTNNYDIWAYGDGSILKLKNDGTIEFTLIEYPSNAPLYLSYYLDSNMFERYKSQFGLERIIYKYIITVDDFSYTSESDTSGEPYIEYGTTDYKVIAVTSDGIASFAKFIDKNTGPANIVEIVREIMGFKSIKGKFIERRLNGFKDFCEKNSIKHTDDFSMAGVSFEK